MALRFAVYRTRPGGYTGGRGRACFVVKREGSRMVSQLLVTIVSLVTSQAFPHSPTSAQSAQAVLPPALQDPSTAVLSQALRDLLVQILPGTLYEAAPGWG